jgi:hypothetical protein
VKAWPIDPECMFSWGCGWAHDADSDRDEDAVDGNRAAEDLEQELLENPELRFAYWEVVRDNDPTTVRRHIRQYIHKILGRIQSAGETPSERRALLRSVRLKQSVLVALGGWAGLEEQLPPAKSDERRTLELTRGFFKLLTVELMPWIGQPQNWRIEYFDVDGMLTHAMMEGLQSVSVWQSLCLVLLPDCYVFLYVVVPGYGHNSNAPIKVGDSGSDPVVRKYFSFLRPCAGLK